MILSAVRLASRGSPLAMWQAETVRAALAPVLAPAPVEIVRIETQGDRDQASALSAMGGYGVFTKAIQQALLADAADIAVHSLKDLPTLVTDGVALAGVLPRGPTGDALVSRKHRSFAALPRGARVGTSSLRRRAQILHQRPDLTLLELRGNVDTRLRKLHDLDLDAIVLAEAGLVRLGLGHRITEVLDVDWMLPAVGQGAIGLECRTPDAAMVQLARSITCARTWALVLAERAMLAALGGGCLVPIGVTSDEAHGVLTLRGAVLSATGMRRIVATHRGHATAPLAVGQELAAMLLAEGAAGVLTAR